MRRITALLWKEWHEIRWFLAVGLGLFLGIPLIAGLKSQLVDHQRLDILTEPMVLLLGGVWAMVVAIAITSRDLEDRLEDFWKSRPVAIAPWMVLKYFVGLLVVFAGCIVPLVVEMEEFNRGRALGLGDEVVVTLAWLPFQWMALYSIAFLCGCCLRRATPAMMAALVGMLLVYLLPIVLPPFKWLNVLIVIERSAHWQSPSDVHYGLRTAQIHRIPWIPWPAYYEPRQLIFVGGMLALSAVALLVAVMAVRRGWRLRAGRQAMYWSIGSTLILVEAAVAFQIGTNLPILQEIKLEPRESVVAVQCDGVHGIMLTKAPPRPRSHVYYARVLLVNTKGVQLGPPIAVPEVIVASEWDEPFAWDRRCPTTLYVMDAWTGRLFAIAPDTGGSPAAGHVDLPAPTRSNENAGHVQLCADGGRLYVVETVGVAPDLTRIMVALDTSKPERPRILYNSPFINEPEPRWGAQTISFKLLPIANASPRERLAISLQIGCYDRPRLDGDTLLVRGENDRFYTYGLTDLSEQSVRFEKLGGYGESPLEQTFGYSYIYSARPAVIANGMAYLSYYGSRLAVYDIREPRQPRPVGHFAVPSDWTFAVCPLPDGRALVGGDRLYLLGKPPVRD